MNRPRLSSRLTSFLGAVLLAGSFALHAQTPSAPPAGAAGTEGHKGMSSEQRQKMREGMKAAHEACKDKSDRGACMREQMCAKAADPAKCQAEGKQRMSRHMDERQKAHEACTGKRGDELMSCLKAQRPAKSKHEHGKPEGKG